MEEQQTGEPISEDELEAFTGKLQEWGSGLSTRERGILQLMIARASGTDPADVQGYAVGRLSGTLFPALQSYLIYPVRGGGLDAWGDAGDDDPWVMAAPPLHLP